MWLSQHPAGDKAARHQSILSALQHEVDAFGAQTFAQGRVAALGAIQRAHQPAEATSIFAPQFHLTDGEARAFRFGQALGQGRRRTEQADIRAALLLLAQLGFPLLGTALLGGVSLSAGGGLRLGQGRCE